jgi:RNA polymerase sigma factor (sigma-70 family)
VSAPTPREDEFARALTCLRVDARDSAEWQLAWAIVLRELIDRWMSTVAYFSPHDADARQDLLQQAAIRLVRLHARQPDAAIFLDPEQLRRYASRIIRAVCLDHSRSKRRYENLLAAARHEAQVSDDAFEDPIARERLMIALERAISVLPPESQRLVQLLRLGASSADIAEELEITPENARQRARRLRRTLAPLVRAEAERLDGGGDQ